MSDIGYFEYLIGILQLILIYIGYCISRISDPNIVGVGNQIKISKSNQIEYQMSNMSIFGYRISDLTPYFRSDIQLCLPLVFVC